MNNHTWAVVLAGGEGTRLRELTTVNGIATPKQFCALNGGPCLLQRALQRASAVASPEHTGAIVAASHQQWWEMPLSNVKSDNIIIQPENRGTAIGVLLTLEHVLARDPGAILVLLPADHYVSEEAPMASALTGAVRLAERDPGAIYLLGIEPDEADPELGYIVARPDSIRHARPVSRFVEKPNITVARDLWQQGALWNALIVVAAAQALLDLYAPWQASVNAIRHLLAPAREQSQYAAELACLYRHLPTVDFSHEVLETHADRLRVISVPPCGWTDLRTPRRVAAVVDTLSQQPESVPDGLASTPYLNLADQLPPRIRRHAHV